MNEEPLVTKTGRVLTDSDIEALAHEAERGYELPEHWLVTWTWDSDAETPEQAAREALAAQRRPGSIATVFTVTDHHNTYEVDLTEGTTRLVRQPDSSTPAKEDN